MISIIIKHNAYNIIIINVDVYEYFIRLDTANGAELNTIHNRSKNIMRTNNDCIPYKVYHIVSKIYAMDNDIL